MTARFGKIAGLKVVQARLERLTASQAEGALEAAARAAAMVVEGEWKGLFRSPDEASVPGLPPRRQTGSYSRSVHTEVVERSRERAVAEVGTDLEYAWFLEYGTSRMEPRPIARPALEQSRVRAAAEAWRILLRAAGIR